MRAFSVVFGTIILGAIWSCQGGVQPPDARFGDDIVAKAFGEILTWDSLASQVPDDLSLEDSAAFAERVLDLWMREQVLVNEAKKQLSNELPNIEEALEAYRQSLLINTYENRYVESRLDRRVSEDEILAYYHAHPELFTLHDHAVQVLYLHLPDPKIAAQTRGANWSRREERAWNNEANQVKEWLSNADSTSIPKLERWCIERGAVHHVNHEAWWFVRDLVDEVPLSLYRVEAQIQRTSPLSFVDNDRVYFVRFLNHGLKGKTAPIDVARDQIMEILLQGRRQKLRESLRDTLLQRAWAEGHLRRENL